MGTPMAPAIANLYMGWLEDQLLATSPWTIQQNRWKRYIDDILLLWTLGEKELLQFLKWLNEQHEAIKFTWNYGKSQIPYLDVSLSIVDGRLVTDLHVKPTDANMLLPFHSSHSRHCMRSIPFGQSLRLRRICSTDELFHKRSEGLKQKLMKRGYPKTLLEAAITKVANMPRGDTLSYRGKTQSQERVPVVITHNPTHPPLGRWLKELMPTLHQNRRMKKAVPHPPIIGERNCHNLRRILMPTKPPKIPEKQEEPGCYKCSAKRCIVCQIHLQETIKFRSVRTGQSFTIRTRGTCKSTNLVYLIDCAKCGDTQYVGETGQTLQRRFHAHRSSIGVNPESRNQAAPTRGVGVPQNTATNSRFNQDTLVARHFQGPGHSVLDMRVTLIEVMEAVDTTTRRARERFWPHKLKTNWPDGLNVFD